MSKFDPALWAQIAPRLRELRDGENVEKFLARHDLLGLHWRMLEQGRQGTSVESLAKICEKLDTSATWLLFGKGRKKLSMVKQPQRAGIMAKR